MFYPSFCEQKQTKITTNSNSLLRDNKFLEPSVKSSQLIIENALPSNFSNHHLCIHKNCSVCDASKNLPSADIQKLLEIHKTVHDSGRYNFQQCRIRVNDKINVDYMRLMLRDYHDLQVCDLLEFGFPLGFKGDTKNLHTKDQIWKYKNHKGALEFPRHINEYITKECSHKAILGPFKDNPFQDTVIISPLNIVPKKEPDKRRIIMDLSYPKGNAVNDYIDKNEYLGESSQVIFPKVDDFVELIKSKGKGCMLFKKDLARAYRQISVDPRDYNLISFVWRKHIFCDTVLSMGLRSAAYICQRTTNAISFILLQLGIAILNYLDDLAGAERKENAIFAYNCLGTVLQKCGFEESVEKASPPSEIMSFLGVLFNTLTMTMEITPERLIEISSLLELWLHKENATLKQVQSLLGKLNFIAACVKPSRIFVSRLLVWLRSIYSSSDSLHIIPTYVKKDLIWWNRFLPHYNGISLMEYENWSKPDAIFSSDSSLTGCGGFWKGCYFHAQFPEFILAQEFHIGVLEILSIIVCLKLWGKNFKGQRIVVYCDNQSVCQIINSGKSKSEILQDSLREICFLASCYEFELRAIHLSSAENRLSDVLSRWHLDDLNETRFKNLTEGYTLQEYKVSDTMFQFVNDW